MAVSVPSLEQRRLALESANRVRVFRAGLKREVRDGGDLAGLLLEPPQELLSMQVLELLVCVPHVGRVKGLELLRVAGCSPVKRVGGLSVRQRGLLVGALRERGL